MPAPKTLWKPPVLCESRARDELCGTPGKVPGDTHSGDGFHTGLTAQRGLNSCPQWVMLSLPLRLQVEPFASLAGAVRGSVPRVLINRELVGPFAWRQRHNDVAQLGDVVRGVQALVELLGWSRELQALIQKEKEKVGRAQSRISLPQPLPASGWSCAAGAG